MKNPPVAQVKQRFESKEKLVASVEKLQGDLWVDRLNAEKGLKRVSNAKLLRLHDLLAEAKKGFGTRAKLIDAVLKLEGREKDAGYKARLERFAVPRLLDTHRSAQRRAKAAKASA